MTDGPTGPDRGPAQKRSPALIETSTVDGLAVLRRRHSDLNPDHPTVFLVHGAMDRAASFGRVMRRLVDFDVIAYDRRGYAGSIPTAVDTAPGTGVYLQQHPNSIRGHASDLRTVIDWSQARHAVVIGHSLGGTIALALASEGQPNLVSLGVFEAPAPWLDGSFADVGRGAIEVATADGDEAGAEFFYRLMIGEKTFSRLRDRDRTARRAEGPALIAELRSLRDPALAIDLATVTLPVIIGTGSTSSSSLKRGAQLVSEALPDAWGVEIAGSGHGAHLTHPDEFAAYVRACSTRGEVHMEHISGTRHE